MARLTLLEDLPASDSVRFRASGIGNRFLLIFVRL
jgi:hypothetical protein